ncbi:hypothetical protein SCHPADRAFT_208981 [Schizopora paradoxa]|uniref:F-box domain-containing protein n=1 Tax=Schizopora paradoxa TaxID=27342 RepID=A0A0H2RY01_9AGAM|nr:hypothetical protein SCHPADRAFT_208981 [Schizopora paradoxa]
MPSKSTAQSTALMMPDTVTRIIEFAIAKNEFDWDCIKLYHVIDGIHQGQGVWEKMSRNTLQSFMTVCKTWYEITMSTPTLWATFSALLRLPQESYADYVSSMLDMHFRRSKTVPFTLFFFAKMKEISGGDNDDSSIAFRMLERAFTQQGHRLETVYISISTKRALDYTTFTPHPIPTRRARFTMSIGDMPLLKSFNLDLHPWSKLDRDLQLKLVPHSRLENMRINGDVDISVPSSILTATPCLPSLQNLSLSTRNTKTDSYARDILLASPNIEILRLEFQRGSWTLPPQSSVGDLTYHSLPRLRRLDIFSGRSGTSLGMLAHFSLPYLTFLKMEKFQVDDHSLKELSTTLANCPLESCDIAIWSIEDSFHEEAFGSLLNSLGALKYLGLSFSIPLGERQKRVLEALRNALHPGGPNEVSALPGLQKLSVDMSFSDTSEVPGIPQSIVSTCKRKYPSDFSLRLFITISPAGELQEVRRLLLDDTHIRQCISDTFYVSINGFVVKKH